MSEKNKFNIKIHHEIRFTKIYVDEILHIYFLNDELVNIQSWKDTHDKYVIEYVFKTTTTISEYDSIEKWKQILKVLDTAIG